MTIPVPIANMLALPLFDTWAVVDTEWSLRADRVGRSDSVTISGGGPMSALDYPTYETEAELPITAAYAGWRILCSDAGSLRARVDTEDDLLANGDHHGRAVGRVLYPDRANVGVEQLAGGAASLVVRAALPITYASNIAVPVYAVDPAASSQWVTVPSDQVAWLPGLGQWTITGSVRCRVQRLR